MLQGIVIRGTTPEHEFGLPYPKDTIDKIYITYGQNGKSLFIKSKNDCVIDNEKIKVSLTQEETLQFNAKKHLYIEIKIRLNNGKIVQTETPIVLKVIDTMNEEVIR